MLSTRRRPHGQSFHIEGSILAQAQLIAIDYRHKNGRHQFTSPIITDLRCEHVELKPAFEAVTDQLNTLARKDAQRPSFGPAISLEEFETCLVLLLAMETEHFKPRLAAQIHWTIQPLSRDAQ